MIEDVQNNIISCRRPSGIPAKSSSLAMWKLDLLIYGHFFWKRLNTPTSGPLVVATVAEKTDDNMISYTWWRHAIHISSRFKAFSISVQVSRFSPVFELFVSNTSPRTLERSCQSSRAQRQALHCCCPVPQPIVLNAHW